MVHGASLSDEMNSLNKRAGTVVRPSSRTVTGTVALIVRSRLVAMTRRPLSVVSSSTLPSTGRVERGETARETRPRAALRAEGETVAFMDFNSSRAAGVVHRHL